MSAACDDHIRVFDDEPVAPPRQSSGVVPVTALTPAERRSMLSLMHEHYQGVRDEVFAAELAEKEAVVMLRHGNQVIGFSTLKVVRSYVHSIPVTAFFSGDTVVRTQAQGYSELARLWSRHVFACAAEARAHDPERRVYWLLISAGYKTYRFLPLFFRRFLPAHDRPADPFDALAANTLAERRYGTSYDAASGVVRLPHPTPLRPGVAEPSAARRRDPHVAFFLGANPGHALGDELVCLTELHPDNLTRAGRRMVGFPTDPAASSEPAPSDPDAAR